MFCPNLSDPTIKAQFESLQSIVPEYAYYLWDKYQGEVPAKYYNLSTAVRYQLSNQEKEYIASEKTIRDLAARMSDRIGIPVRFESDRSKQYKGKLEDNVAVVNLAYATLDTPIHEILGHPIIRVIKGTNNPTKWTNIVVGKNEDFNGYFISYTNAETGAKETIFTYEDKASALEYKQNLEKENFNYNGNRQLYQNLLKELEYGRGKEVLDRIKSDYTNKNKYNKEDFEIQETTTPFNNKKKFIVFNSKNPNVATTNFNTYEEAQQELERFAKIQPYTLEEQQEEAIVELLGLYTAERLDKVKDGKLISLLKRLLKEIKSFMKDLLSLNELEVNRLPDNMTLGDLADLLAYSNSKLILPGNEVIYTTPDNQRFKTYGEASKHISGLARNVEDINLSNIQLPIINIKNVPKEGFRVYNGETNGVDNPNIIISYNEDKNNWEYTDDDFKTIKSISEKEVLNYYNRFTNSDDVTNGFYTNNPINNFIERNKEYEQAKEIIEEWKKVNNITYNPEEVYSRGQEFVSVLGAYSDFDVNLMMQNLLQHIEDNQKAGGEFTISAFTKPMDRKIGHLEAGGGKIKFKIYPKSKDIKWAANTDVFSGSVWDASTKVSKDKKSELLGVSYTKYPSLGNVNSVQPNLASIIDKLAHHHNELGISLTGNNFRIEYDDDIPYSTKKIINAVNSILDQRYGKLKEPQIQQTRNFTGLRVNYKEDSSFKTVKSYESDIFRLYDISNGRETIKGLKANEFDFIDNVTTGTQPTQTYETLKQSIDSVKEKLNENNLQDEDMPFAPKEQRKEYTSQALINTKIAKLKEVAKKYPRSLIRSEVVRTSEYYPGEFSGFAEDELPFQRIPSTMPTTMFSRQDAKFVSDRFIRLERQYDFVKSIQSDPAYWKMTVAEKKRYVASKHFAEILPTIEGRNSVRIEGNRIYLSQTERIKSSPALYSYALRLKEGINAMFPLVSYNPPATVRELYNGQMLIEFDLNGNYTIPFLQAVETLDEEEIRTEMELFDIQENLSKEKAAIMEKLQSANELLVDGEVLPLNGLMFQKNFSLTQSLKNPNIKAYAQVLNKLVARFPGVTWKWNNELAEAARVNFSTGEIEVNPDLIKEDTPWHEFGHFVVRGIRESNPELFEQLKEEVNRLHEEAPTSSSYTFVTSNYPEYEGTDSFWEEVIVTELGKQAATKANRSLFDKIFDWFKGLLKGFNKGVSQTSNMSNLVDSLVDPSNVFEVIPTNSVIADYMFQRLIPEEQVEALTQYVLTTPNASFEFQTYAEKIQVIASAISDKEFKSILDTNKYLGLGSESLQRALLAIKDVKEITTKEDVAASVLELADYFQYNSIYLQGLIRHLNIVLDNPNIPPGKKLGDLHRAYKQSLAIGKHVKKIKELFNTRALEELDRSISQNSFMKNLSWIEAAIKSIEEKHEKSIQGPVINELVSTLTSQSKSLEEQYDKDIATLKKRTQTPSIAKRVKELELEKQNSLPTAENIKKFLADKNSSWFLAVDSAMSTKNPGVQLIANYIRDINNEFQENLKPVARDWQELMDEVAKSEGGFIGSAINTKNFFKPYIRETNLYEVVDGQLIKTKKVLSLNTEVKTVELRNRVTELKYLIEYGTTPEIQEKAEEDLKKFYEEYTERPFTDEYYEIQKGLPDDIKERRNRLFQELAAIREEFGTGELDDNTLERLRDKQKELSDLERLYTDSGELKQGKPYEDALAIKKWKEDKRNAKVISYVLTDDSKAVFNKMLADKKQVLAKSLALAKTPAQIQAAHDAYNKWASVYTKSTYTQEFYDTRQDILDDIQALLKDRGSIEDLYSNLFNLLSGNKDKDGAYDPSNVSSGQVAKAKEIEEKIENVKALLKQSSPLPQNVKDKLSVLVEDLQGLQSSVNSDYYTSAVETQINTLRSEVTAENPDLDQKSIEALVTRKFKNSDWYKDNHIIKYRYNADVRSVVEVEEPLFMWRMTVPNDPKYFEKDVPSSLWYKAVVNSDFKNDNYKPGEVTFKPVTGGEFYNQGYNSLTNKQKEILARMKELHYRSQEGLYQKDKLGDLIPGIRKTRGEFIDLIKLKANTVKQFFKSIGNYFTGDLETFSDEDDIYGDAYQTDAFGDPVVRTSRRLFNRYARTLPLEEQSYDIMTAMASYATSSERFKLMRKYQSTVLTMEEVLKGAQGGESRAVTVVNDLIDRELYGKVLSDKTNSIALRKFNSIFSGVTSLAGFKTLGFNIISLPQNWTNGYLKIFSQLGFYHITAKDMAKAVGDTLGIAKEFYTAYNQFGAKPYRVSLVDYFTGTQSIANQASEINNKGLAKYGKVWNAVSTLRDFTEFDISAVTTYAFLNKYKVKHKDSNTTVALKDAFELVDGVIQPKSNIEVPEALIKRVRKEIQLANERAQGVYSPEAQPTATKYATYRSLLFLKKWVIPDLKSTWGSETIHYGAGIKTIGSHRAALRFLKDTLYYDKGNAYNTWKYSSDVQKAGLRQFGIQIGSYTLLANLIVQMSLALNCEEDADADWKDYACLGLKRITNEAEGVFTLWGMNEMAFTYIAEQANGVSLFEKIGWAALGPFSVWRKFWTDDDLYLSEPYYKYRSNSTKIDWDKTHPMEAGRIGQAVLAMQALGLRGIFIGPKSIEFQNRAYNDYSPKTYTKELRTRYTKDHAGLELMPTRTFLAQEKKLYKKAIKELRLDAGRYLSQGKPVPQSIKDKAAKLTEIFKKRVEDYKEGKIKEDANFAYPFMNILGDRRGLNVTPDESEYDIEE